jgi:hypothetical protein
MIEEAKGEHPRTPLSDLCELFGVSRSWYRSSLHSTKLRFRQVAEL